MVSSFGVQVPKKPGDMRFTLKQRGGPGEGPGGGARASASVQAWACVRVRRQRKFLPEDLHAVLSGSFASLSARPQDQHRCLLSQCQRCPSPGRAGYKTSAGRRRLGRGESPLSHWNFCQCRQTFNQVSGRPLSRYTSDSDTVLGPAHRVARSRLELS